MTRLLFAAAVWLALSATGLGLEISPPPDNVKPGDDVELVVTGITYQQLPQATLIYFPRDQVRVRGTLSWGLEPRIDFRAKLPGEYLVAVAATIDGQHYYAEVVIEVGGKPPPDDDPPDDDPPPSDLSEFVADLIDELDIDSKTAEVANLFRDAVPKIDDGSLRGSKAIVEAVSKPLAGMGTKWRAFSSLLFGHLLNDLRLVTQSQWGDAYREVVQGLGGES